MDRKLNVLVFPAGSESGLDIYESLRYVVNIEVFGISGKHDNSEFSYPPDHFMVADFYVNAPGFYDRLNEIIHQWQIDVVIPTHDTIVYELSKNVDKIDALTLVADKRTTEICRYKSLTLDLFKDCGFCPRFYSSPDEVKKDSYPVFIKPDTGQGGQGAKLVQGPEDFPQKNMEDFVICEYLPGEEYTVDCLTSKDGVLKFCGLRRRDRIHMGIAFRSTALPMPPELEKIANEINKRLKFLGVWFFQVKKDVHGKFKLMEVASRHAGTMTLYRHKGINFSLLSIYELLGIDTKIINNNFNIAVDRYLRGLYKIDIKYNTIYIDFDDTITYKDKVNLKTLTFIYQAVNNKKNIVLLTRHAYDIDISLNKYKISKSIFDEIIEVPKDKNKSEFISKKDAIFIDNSFAERLDVSERCNIPVFDVDNIDTLLERIY